MRRLCRGPGRNRQLPAVRRPDRVHPVLLTAANSRGETGQVRAAQAELFRLRSITARLIGEDHPDTLTIRGCLANLQGEAGDIRGAVAALEELLADRLRILGADHRDTLANRGGLADWH